MIAIEKALKSAIGDALDKLLGARPDFDLVLPKEEKFGDFTTNAALIAAPKLKKPPRKVAEELIAAIAFPNGVAKADIAGPGFINFSLDLNWFRQNLQKVEKQGEVFGNVDLGVGKKAQVEFVSANPTGPLHIGHGRGAVYGDTLARMLAAAGYEVTREYYINDAGRQMNTLGASVYARALELSGKGVEFQEDWYQGDYIKDIAKEVMAKNADLLSIKKDDAVAICRKYAGDKIFEEIKLDLKELGIVHDVYFSESTLHKKGELDIAIGKMRERGYVFDDSGATWFKSTAFGDDKDRVLIKSDGEYTYLAADIAYHLDKYERGFAWVIDIWGADHAGYVARMKAAVEAFGYPADAFTAVLIQLVNLVRAGEVVSMSTRRATYETLEDVRKLVGRDVCRYFFLMRSHNAQLDFDLALAEKQTPENPVFYIQYAHARIASVFKKAASMGHAPSSEHLHMLDLPEEISLMRKISALPLIVAEVARTLEPHRVAYYLLEVSRLFQSYYSRGKGDERYKFISDDVQRTGAKLYLLKNLKQVLFNGLNLLGISAPEEMRREGEDE